MWYHIVDRLGRLDTGQTYHQLMRGSLHFRSLVPMAVYWSPEPEGDEVLAGHGTSVVVEMPPGYWKVAAEDDVYVMSKVRNQETYRVSDEKFTTLDRPPPLSPEMAAIQRLSRLNEIERERMRKEFESAAENLKREVERDTRRDRERAHTPEAVSEEPEERGGSREAFDGETSGASGKKAAAPARRRAKRKAPDTGPAPDDDVEDRADAD